MRVERIDKDTAKAVVENKHYSRRLGIFWEGYGLFDGGTIVGVCCYGQPSAPIQKHAFRDRTFRLYELTRLVVDAGVTNGASMLVGKSLQMLTDRPCAVISYADSAQGHCGIVYQATNWIYTGAVVAHDSAYIVNGERLHPMTLRDRYGVTEPAKWARENKIEVVRPQEKHRYFFFCGTKRQRQDMAVLLNYPAVSGYPKREKAMYMDGAPCREYVQSRLI